MTTKEASLFRVGWLNVEVGEMMTLLEGLRFIGDWGGWFSNIVWFEMATLRSMASFMRKLLR